MLETARELVSIVWARKPAPELERKKPAGGIVTCACGSMRRHCFCLWCERTYCHKCEHYNHAGCGADAPTGFDAKEFV